MRSPSLASRPSQASFTRPWIAWGQILFRPPSVKGWPSGTAWLSSGAVVERLATARRIADLATDQAAEDILETAFEGVAPTGLAGTIEKLTGRDRVAFVLGCPAFQTS